MKEDACFMEKLIKAACKIHGALRVQVRPFPPCCAGNNLNVCATLCLYEFIIRSRVSKENSLHAPTLRFHQGSCRLGRVFQLTRLTSR